MQSVTITVGKRAQVVIPKKAREAIGLKEGKKATLVYETGLGILMGNSRESIKLLKGLGKEIWGGKGEEYLEEERNSWDRDL